MAEPLPTLSVPARTLPVPSSISPEAQSVLANGFWPKAGGWPAPDDLDAWRRLVRARDEQIGSMMQLAAEAVGVGSERGERDVGGVPVYTVVPAGAATGRVLFDIHGGALIFQGGECCRSMAVLMAAMSRLPTWSVDYRMPPDHPFPAGLDDCVAAYRALLAEVPAERIVFNGASAGGNLGAATLLRARDEGLPMPAALVLQTPEVDLTESGDSFRTNDGVDSVIGSFRAVNELYAGGHDLAHPHLSPLFGDLTGFPPTILTTGTRDLFLSNTVLMHRALRRAGVEAELHVIEAAPHGGFMGMAPEDAEVTAEVRRFIDRHCPSDA